MPAVSKKQRRFFGMVHAGLIPKPPGLTETEVREFAKTKERGLPRAARASVEEFRRRRMR